MKITFTQTFEIDAPDGATHYTGDLLDEVILDEVGEPSGGGVTWYKYTENTTGTFKGWCYYRRTKDHLKNLEPGWYIHGEYPPHFLKELPK